MHTQTGSVYEFDEANKRVRRQGKERPGQTRAAAEWRPYEKVSVLILGKPMAIVWPSEVPLLKGSPEDAEPGTVTSPVTTVETGVPVSID